MIDERTRSGGLPDLVEEALHLFEGVREGEHHDSVVRLYFGVVRRYYGLVAAYHPADYRILRKIEILD